MSSSTMKAVVFKGVKEVVVEDRPLPKNDSKSVICKVRDAGLCGSELHVFRGHQKSATGFIMGHEFVGEVTEVGDDIKNFKKGDRVIAPFTTSW